MAAKRGRRCACWFSLFVSVYVLVTKHPCKEFGNEELTALESYLVTEYVTTPSP
jgi:hypothetical protein